MICFGQLRHRFYGDYSAIVGIILKTPDEAQRASVLFPGFEIQDKAIVKLVRQPELDELKLRIDHWRIYPDKAHRGPIDGVPFSIDTGPLFHLDLTQALIDHHNSQKQLQLFKEST